MINFGKLKHRIQIISFTKGQDDYGEFKDEFKVICSPYAKIKYLDDGESDSNRIDISKVKAEIIIRFNKAVKSYTPDMFIKIDGKTFEIDNAIDPYDDKRYLKISATLRI